jgi:hypothetical protein
MASTILSDNGVSSGSAGIKTSADGTGVLALQTTTAGGAATTAVTIDTSQNVGIGTASPAVRLDVQDTAAIARVTSTTGTNAVRYQIVNTGGTSQFGRESSGGGTILSGADGYSTVLTGSGAYPMIFGTNSAERMRIDSSGNVLINTTSTLQNGLFNVLAKAGGTGIGVQVSTNGNYGLSFGNASGTNVGRIQIDSTATQFVTSSDYRLKNSISPMTGALAKVALLKPCTYKWKLDNSDGEGFIAHELQEVVPYAVSGEKDGEQMQGVDYSKLTPILTAALQEAIAKIENLEARIAVLEVK